MTRTTLNRCLKTKMVRAVLTTLSDNDPQVLACQYVSNWLMFQIIKVFTHTVLYIFRCCFRKPVAPGETEIRRREAEVSPRRGYGRGSTSTGSTATSGDFY